VPYQEALQTPQYQAGQGPYNQQGYQPVEQPINKDFMANNELSDGLRGNKLTNNTRMGFIRKVFGLVATMLTTTALFVLVPMYSQPVEDYIKDEKSLWLVITCCVISLVCIYALGCYVKIARSVPINYILLGVFCLCQSWMVACVTAFYEPESVLIAALITSFMTIGLSIYAITTKTDFTWCVALMWSLCFILIICSILSCFFYSRWMVIMISAIVVFIVSIYIIIDIQLITGKHAHKYLLDDYVMAAMSLYMDIIRLFLELLRIFGEVRN